MTLPAQDAPRGILFHRILPFFAPEHTLTHARYYNPRMGDANLNPANLPNRPNKRADNSGRCVCGDRPGAIARQSCARE